MSEPIWDSDNVVRASVALLLFLLLVAASAKSVWCNRTWLHSLAQGLCSEVLSHAAWQKQLDPIEQRVAQRCSERRIVRARAAATVFVFFGLAWVVFGLQRLVRGTSTMTLWHAAPYQLLIGTTGIVSLCPGIITERTIDVIYIWGIILISAAVVGEGGQMPELYDIYVAMGMICICLFNLRPRINAVGLMLVAVTETFVSFSETAAIGWVQLFCVFLMLCWIDHTLVDSVRTEILAQNSRGELAAVKTLLGTICDVVVELDNALCLTHHSESFSDILLHGSGRSLQGSTVQEFMPEDADRRKFEERLCNADKASAHAEVFHATISDSGGTRISMEFFSVAFAGPDTRRHHLLGMREFTDIVPLTPSPRFRQHAPARPARQTWPGTPATAGRTDIGFHSPPAPDTISVASSGSSRPAAPPQEPQGPPRPRRETTKEAKTYTLAEAMMRWQVPPPEAACCSFHAVTANATEILGEMAARPCNDDFGPVCEWQCARCGIAAEEFRDERGGRRCLLCKIMEVESRGSRSSSGSSRGSSRGSGRRAALASL